MPDKKNKEETSPEKEDTTSSEKENQDNNLEDPNGLTQVKNAHASGLGSMGGYDEDLQDQPSNNSADDY
jgi:hypothetical protein